ncbi:MAG: trigger factor [Chlamydiales bacterium]
MTTQSKESQLTSENVDVEVTRNPGCQVVMEVFVKPKATQAAHKKAIKSINKEISLPGFRKGKAPEALVIKNYGKVIKDEWNEVLLNTSFAESTKLAGIHPLGRNSVKRAEVVESSLEEGSKVCFEFESYPEVPDVSPEEFELKAAEVKEISEADIEESVERVRNMCAESVEVNDRPVQEGDTIEVDIDLLTAEEKNVAKDQAFELTEGAIEPGLHKAVIGLAIGENKEFSPELPEDAPKEEMQKHRVTIKKILSKVLPELDDELAKKVGAESIEKMKESLTERLKHEAQAETKDLMRKQIDTVLLEKYLFEVPSSLKEAERRGAIKDKIAQMKHEKQDDEAIKAKQQEIEEEVEKQVDEKLRLLFLTQTISEKESISVTQEELNQKMGAHAMELAMGGWGTKSDEEKQKIYAYFSSVLMEEKVKDFLIGKAKIA